MNERQSNIELLRIISILFITIGHFFMFSIYPEATDLVPEDSLNRYFVKALWGVLICGVNIFVLISGYFGIHPTLRRFLTLYLMCGFYAVLPYVVQCLNGNPVDIFVVFQCVIFPFSTSNWWFITCYLGLFFISPILNIAKNGFNKSEYVIALLLLTILNVYFGHFRKLSLINDNGYTIMQMLYMYMVGGFIKRFIGVCWLKKCRLSLVGYTLLSIILFDVLFFLESFSVLPSWFGIDTRYNCLFVIISSILIFMLALSFDFKSSLVNWLASSVLAVYLFQMTFPVVFTLGGGIAMKLSPIYRPACLMMLASLFVVLVLVVDKFRITIFKPIWYCLNPLLKRFEEMH